MEILFDTRSRIITSNDATHNTGNDHEINFPAWYNRYKQASMDSQKEMENNLEQALYTYPDLAMTKDSNGDLPLHHILAESREMMGPVSIELFQSLLNACPECVHVPDRKGLLPLHIACRYGDCWSYDVIHCLLKAWPESAQVKAKITRSKYNMLPLHIACEFGPMSFNIIKLIVAHYPKALSTPNGKGDLPMHLACKGYNVSTSTLSLLYKAFPGALEVPNNKGELPLHIVCGRRNQNSLEVIKFIFQLNSNAIRYRNMKGELPLHYACNGYQKLNVIRFLVSKSPGSLRVPDAAYMLPIHHSCKTVLTMKNVIHFLWKEYPESLTTRDKDGFLPLHYACRVGCMDTIKFFLDVCPESATDTNNKDGKAPLEMACKHKNPSSDIVRLLASVHPKPLHNICGSTTSPVHPNILKAYCKSETLEQSADNPKRNSITYSN